MSCLRTPDYETGVGWRTISPLESIEANGRLPRPRNSARHMAATFVDKSEFASVCVEELA